MKTNNLYLLMAREVAIDTTDNMNSIIKIIEKFSSNSTLPRQEWEAVRKKQDGKTLIQISYAIASSWLFEKKLAEDAFVTLRIETFDPSGTKIAGMEQEHMIPKGTGKANLNLNMQGLIITVPGAYTLRASLFSKTKKLLTQAEYPYEVELTWDSSAS
jgi:hypothetical protein